MKNKLILLIVFIVVALIQLYIPASMMLSSEAIIGKGTEYKFRVAPIDPNDPFRGKYVTLSFAANIYYDLDSLFYRNQEVFVVLGLDDEGFVRIDDVASEQPFDSNNYVKAKVNSIYKDYGDEGRYVVRIDYPFNRFYMEESKAPEAESLYWEAARDTNQVAYALVRVKEGEAVLLDVLINDISLKDLTGEDIEIEE
ncbi:MAG: GDYXXLXY domain-containing protein [Chloroflexia bacterium]|nr:GDYXXLXY domain-containing protein [Chloroflexia bacterium]